jgi:predicted alpha/beta superfamily hydrolase
MAEWIPYELARAGQAHTVVGNVQVLAGLESPQLGNRRDILVYLPPSYERTAGRYPVLYLHDGQNLFDATTSFAGEWQVDESMEALSQEGLEAIVVGVSNAGRARLDEYSPFPQPPHGGGRGDHYLAFLVETVKPLIDAYFRTRPERDQTGIVGSSMGGLISLYAYFRFPEVFGRAGVMSPSLWFGRGAIYDYVQQAPYVSGQIYLDVGTRELGDGHGGFFGTVSHSRRYYTSVRRMHRLLVRKGYRPKRELLYIEDKWAGHGEDAWARRLPVALRFLLDD